MKKNLISHSARLSKKNIFILSATSIFILGTGLVQALGRFGTSTSNKTLAGETVPFDTVHHMNIERLDREIATNQMNEAQMKMIWKRLPYYKPMIDKKLKEAGVPSDIFYLALAESALRETAVSSAGAAGIWQFMPATASGYGLRVDSMIDQRLDTEKATDAAISYLKKAHQKFGSRTLAMAAYNRGSSGISSDMAYQYQNNFYDLYLNNETYRYIFRILAFKEIFENLNTYFDTSKWGAQYSLPQTTIITLGRTENLAARAAGKGYTYHEIRVLNPRIRSNKLPE